MLNGFYLQSVYDLKNFSKNSVCKLLLMRKKVNNIFGFFSVYHYSSKTAIKKK